MAIDSPCSVSALQACAFPVRGSGDACADGEYYSQTYYSEPLREALPSAAACTTRRDVAHTKEETAPAAPATSSPIRDEIAKAAAYAWGKILATAVAVGTVSGTIKLMFTESMEAIENKLRKSE